MNTETLKKADKLNRLIDLQKEKISSLTAYKSGEGKITDLSIYIQSRRHDNSQYFLKTSFSESSDLFSDETDNKIKEEILYCFDRIQNIVEKEIKKNEAEFEKL